MLFYDDYGDWILESGQGVGLELTTSDGDRVLSVVEFPRRATLLITSWRGWGIAQHWYGSIHVAGPAFKFLADSKWHRAGDVAYLGGAHNNWKPNECQDIKIELTRPVLNIEAGTPRYKHLSAGDLTNAFNSKLAVIERAVEVFRAHFRGQWVLIHAISEDVIDSIGEK